MVVAGPGAGKTRVLVNRLQFLVSEAHIDPSSILTITFTRAAGTEMKSRAQELLGDAAASVTFGTFHSVFFNILRNTYRFTSENIINPEIQFNILSEILMQKEVEILDFRRSAVTLLSEISRVKCGKAPEEVSSAVLSEELFPEVCRLYRQRMNDLRLIDFDDMVLRVVQLFSERPEVLRRWQEKFRFILVDECQDMDPAQYKGIRMLAGNNANLFMVGDDDQSIYSFRGADPSVMQDFIRDYPGAAVIHLSTNYRSHAEIVDAASKVIAENENRLEKEIRANKKKQDDDRPDGSDRIDIRGFKSREEEINALRDELKNHKGQLNERAILVRTNSLVSFIAEKLTSFDIPCRSGEKITNPYDHFIAQDIFAYLRQAGGDMSRRTFYRVMNRPYRCISRNAVRGCEFNFDELEEYHKYDVKTLSQISKYRRDLAALSKMRPYAAVHFILNGMGYLSFLRDYAAKKRLEYRELKVMAEEMKERAREFRSFAAWEESAEQYRYEIQKIQQRGAGNSDQDAVTIMTLHRSKGLEFNEVFLTDVNEGILPSDKSVLKSDIEEERRLFYVGMTRAEERLHIWYIKDDHGKAMTKSRFLRVICNEKDGNSSHVNGALRCGVYDHER